jgi:hypothetical protein
MGLLYSDVITRPSRKELGWLLANITGPVAGIFSTPFTITFSKNSHVVLLIHALNTGWIIVLRMFMA